VYARQPRPANPSTDLRLQVVALALGTLARDHTQPDLGYFPEGCGGVKVNDPLNSFAPTTFVIGKLANGSPEGAVIFADIGCAPHTSPTKPRSGRRFAQASSR
jgi:hypothetical protein